MASGYVAADELQKWRVLLGCLRAIGVTQKTAWFMLQRVRLAMQDNNTGGKLGGEIEVDKTFIGGRARNMHADKRAERVTDAGRKGKLLWQQFWNMAVKSGQLS